jgi:hypothetical protein
LQYARDAAIWSSRATAHAAEAARFSARAQNAVELLSEEALLDAEASVKSAVKRAKQARLQAERSVLAAQDHEARAHGQMVRRSYSHIHQIYKRCLIQHVVVYPTLHVRETRS